MRLLNLTLNEFRNFQRQQITFRPRVNFLVGENGQGKTNLLEAIYLLCRGTSFRAADSESLLRREGPGKAKIHGNFLKANLDYSVDMTLEAGRKSATVNGKRANAVSLASHFPVILFSPESLAAIKSGPDQRRQLIDEILMNHDPKQARLLREFQRALKSRNRLLKNISEGLGHRHFQLESLASLNKIYFLLATHLSEARIRALKDLAPDFAYAMKSILDEAPKSGTADIAVDYVISGDSAMAWSESEIFDALQKRHLELAIQEQASGTSLVGPHKHDIKFLFAGNDSRFYCSQGQQRALILALKIAQIVYHHRVHKTYPVLLLDDVMSELDAKKRFNLMKFLEGIFAQILLTATDLTWPSQLNSDSADQDLGAARNSVFSVEAGHVGTATV